MEMWRENVQQDISELKNKYSRLDQNHSRMKDDIRDLQMNDKLQDQAINTLKADISEIKDDTSWIRRKITGAIITAIITAVVAGLIGIALANIF